MRQRTRVSRPDGAGSRTACHHGRRAAQRAAAVSKCSYGGYTAGIRGTPGTAQLVEPCFSSWQRSHKPQAPMGIPRPSPASFTAFAASAGKAAPAHLAGCLETREHAARGGARARGACTGSKRRGQKRISAWGVRQQQVRGRWNVARKPHTASMVWQHGNLQIAPCARSSHTQTEQPNSSVSALVA